MSSPEKSGSLVLPWPDRTLHPNERPHWRVLAKAKKAARENACILAKVHFAQRPQDFKKAGRLDLWIEFYPPNKRRRDDDGLISSFKSYRDGIADALGIDDSRFVTHPFVSDKVRPGGVVEVRITATPAEGGAHA